MNDLKAGYDVIKANGNEIHVDDLNALKDLADRREIHFNSPIHDCRDQKTFKAGEHPFLAPRLSLPLPKEPIEHSYAMRPLSQANVIEIQEPNVTLISWMWILTAINAGIYAWLGASYIAGSILVDIPTVVFAIKLAFSKNKVDKANGWVKISMEIIAAAIGFYIGLKAATGQVGVMSGGPE